MQRQHTGRGRPVIPADWTTGPAAVVEGTLSGTCSIRRPGTTGTGPIDQATGQRTGTPYPAHWAGSCEVWPLTQGERASLIGDEEVTVVDHGVKLPAGAAPEAEVDDIVTVTGLGEFVVASIPDASRTFSRVLLCTRHQP